MLNRLGHGVSYSQLEQNDTALCLQKMAANLNQKLVLPGTIPGADGGFCVRGGREIKYSDNMGAIAPNRSAKGATL